MATVTRLVRDFFLGGIACYRWLIAPCLGSCCRFYPSCSQYALDAFEKRGVFMGLFLTTKRLLKCHPYHPGGFDYVPQSD